MSNFDSRLPAGWKVRSDDSGSRPAAKSGKLNPRVERELDQISGTGPQKKRTLPIKVLAPLLIEAHQRGSTWLDDFADDVAVIDADLHEVLLAYQNLRQTESHCRHGDSQSSNHQRRNAA